MPRGSAFPSVSGIWGIPVLFEKRTMTGVEGAVRWWATESSLAAGVGTQVPVSMKPLAWAEVA